MTDQKTTETANTGDGSRLHHFFRGKTATLVVGGRKPTGFKSFGPGRPWFRIIAGLAVIASLAVGVAYGEKKVASIKLSYENSQISQTIVSQNSQRNSAWQAKYGNAISDRKIFYVDSDAIDLAMGVGILTNQPTTRAEILMKMVHDRTGVWVNPYMIPMLEEGFANGHTEFSVQMEREHGLILRGGDKEIVCVVVPSDPNRSARDIVAMVAGVPKEALRWYDAAGKPMFDVDTMRDYVDAHESSHCMDKRWAGDHDEAPASVNRHRAELFGDVHASLMLAQQGKTDLARKLADVRAVGLATAGRAIATRALQKDGDPAEAVPYSMSLTLIDTQETIDKLGVDAIKKMSPAQLKALAYQIVEKNAMNEDQLRDLGYFLAAGDKYVEFLQTQPDGVKRIENLTRFKTFMSEAAGRLIDRQALAKAAISKLTGSDDQGYTQETFEAKVEELWKTEILDKARGYGGGAVGIARAITEFRNAVRIDIAADKTIDIARMELLKNIGMRLSVVDDETYAVVQQAAPIKREGGSAPTKPSRRPPPVLTEPQGSEAPVFTVDKTPSPNMGR